jgi:hypothetical protein
MGSRPLCFGARLAFSEKRWARGSGGAMSYRRFSDMNGGSWEAWEVHPTAVERRVNADRRARPRGEPDRRKHREFRLIIPRELSDGWLAVQGPTKLRVAPIPDGWMQLSDRELADLVVRTALSAKRGALSGPEANAP